MKTEAQTDVYLRYKTRDGALIPFSGHKRTLLETLHGNNNVATLPTLDAALNPNNSLTGIQITRRRNAAVSGANELFSVYESNTRIVEERLEGQRAYRLKDGLTQAITICDTQFIFDHRDALICSLMLQGKSEEYIRRLLFSDLELNEQRIQLYAAWSKLASTLRKQHILLTIDPGDQGIHFSAKRESNSFTL